MSAFTVPSKDSSAAVLQDENLLSNVFTFIDIWDVPNVARVSKLWGKALRIAETELWLALVRRHHPVIEKTTKLLLKKSPKGSNKIRSREGAAPACSNRDSLGAAPTLLRSSTDNFPPRCGNWKNQFKKRQLSVKKTRVVKKARSRRPLSSYVIQIDFICLTVGNYDRYRRVGTVSTVVETIEFDKGRSGIKFDVNDIHDELSRLDFFFFFDIAVHLIHISTGKKTLLFQGTPKLKDWEYTDRCQYNTFYDMDKIGIYRTLGVGLRSHVEVKHTGCTLGFQGDSFFVPPDWSSVSKVEESQGCKCKALGSCFYNFSVSVVLKYSHGTRNGIVDLNKDGLLTLFEEGLLYS